jgi:hypothetical protein
MLAGALALSAAGGLVAALLGGAGAGVMLAVVVNFAAAVGKLAFESIVQRDAPQANRGRAFARFETRFQLAWAVAGLIPVLIVIPGRVGFLVVGLVSAASVLNLAAGNRASSAVRLRLARAVPRLRRAAPAEGRPLPPPRPEGRRNAP